MDRSGHTGAEAGDVRHLVLIDAENLARTASPTPLDLAFAEATLREAIGDLDRAQCVVACSHRAAKTVAFAFPGARRRWRSGPDGADRALIEEMADHRVMRRFDRVTLVSGDGIFADSLAALAALGIETTAVSWESGLSRRLRMAARQVVTLAEDETTLGEGRLVARAQRYDGAGRDHSGGADRATWSCGSTEPDSSTGGGAAR